MRDQDPVFYDALFRQKRKGGKWRVMPSPVLEGPVADTHAHLQMLADPACELARGGAHGVAFVETIVDPAEDGFATFDVLPLWLMEAARDLKVMEEEDDGTARHCRRSGGAPRAHRGRRAPAQRQGVGAGA